MSYESSREAFDAFAGLDSPDLPSSKLDATQVRLCRWVVANFGAASFSQHALALTEECGEMLEAMECVGAVERVHQEIGDALICIAQCATDSRLAFSIIWESLDVSCRPPFLDEGRGLLAAVGRVSRAALKREQKIRGFDDDEVFRRAAYAALSEVACRIFWLTLEHGVEPLSCYLSRANDVVQRDWRADRYRGGPTSVT